MTEHSRMDRTPSTVIREDVRAISAYHVPDSRGLVKLDAMENPYSLPDDLCAEIAQIAARATLNRYPDAGAAQLKERLRIALQIPPSMDLLLGNGSDEIIQILALAVNRPGAVLLGVDPSFVMFRMIATFAGLRYVGVPLMADFTLDTDRLLAAVRNHQPALIFIAYPNNPTGNLFDSDALCAMIEAAPGLVVIDEAYHAFADRSFVPALDQYPNLLVMRTLSKLGLAGLRLGMLIGRPDWIGELDKLRLPYNVNVLTQLVAARVLERTDILNQQAVAIRDERARVFASLKLLPGVLPYPSDANFILFRIPHADAVFSGLRARGVLIKNLNGGDASLADTLRVTIGTPAENARFLDALAETLPRAA